MPAGTRMLAARTGIVSFVRDQFTDNDHGKDEGNAIVFLHEDTTIALYGHFTKNGVTVKVGQKVEQGEIIGLSGNSGQSPVPHLHIQVNDKPDFSIGKSIPPYIPQCC